MLDPIYGEEVSPFSPISGVFNRSDPKQKHAQVNDYNMNTLKCKKTL